MFHVVIDLEMNPVNKNFRDVRRSLSEEVIEIGAIKLDDDYKIIDKFQCYVQPQYGKITRHITQLTCITQEQVANSSLFPEAFQNFMEWIGTWDMILYSWSDSDIKQLKAECKFKIRGYNFKKLESCWKDLQKTFDERLGIHSNLSLKYAIGAMNRDFAGTQHTALADATNTASILQLLQDDEEFSRVMQPTLDVLKSQELSQSIGDLCPDLAKLKLD